MGFPELGVLFWDRKINTHKEHKGHSGGRCLSKWCVIGHGIVALTHPQKDMWIMNVAGKCPRLSPRGLQDLGLRFCGLKMEGS